MRLSVVAVGRLKDGPERELAARYQQRFEELGRRLGLRGLVVHEVAESRARDAAARQAEEAAAIAARCPSPAVLVLLDERGRPLDSADFAGRLAALRDAGTGDLTFIIGGADGLSPELRRKASLTLAFGAATWPHQLVRVMLLEQLYRAATIIAGHPYHRG